MFHAGGLCLLILCSVHGLCGCSAVQHRTPRSPESAFSPPTELSRLEKEIRGEVSEPDEQAGNTPHRRYRFRSLRFTSWNSPLPNPSSADQSPQPMTAGSSRSSAQSSQQTAAVRMSAMRSGSASGH